LQPGQRAGRFGHHGRLSRRRHHHCQRAGHRHRRRQGDLQLHARDRGVLHRREADPPERAHSASFGAGGAGLCAGASGRTGGEGSPRLGRLWHVDRADLLAEGNRRVRGQAARTAGQLYRPAHAFAVDRAHSCQGRSRAAPRGLAALRAGFAQR
ncbi:hypothetical protein OY671_012189, partial [Metschnikowia pulcherrima]